MPVGRDGEHAKRFPSELPFVLAAGRRLSASQPLFSSPAGKRKEPQRLARLGFVSAEGSRTNMFSAIALLPGPSLNGEADGLGVHTRTDGDSQSGKRVS